MMNSAIATEDFNDVTDPARARDELIEEEALKKEKIEAIINISMRRIMLYVLATVIGGSMILAWAIMSVINPVLWILLGILGGLGAGSLLIFEAQTSKRGFIARTCFNIAGFILLYEVIMLLNATITKSMG